VRKLLCSPFTRKHLIALTFCMFNISPHITRVLFYFVALALTAVTLHPFVALSQSASETYRFSPGGKILYKEGVGEYEYKDPRHPHAPTRAGDTVYTYDGVGSRISESRNGETTTYKYNGFNQLERITDKNNTTKYLYDGNGIRAVKIRSDGTVITYPTKLTEVETRGLNTTYTNYLFLNNQRIATTKNGITNYNITDHLNSTSLVLDQTANVIQKLDYMPYGAERVNIQTPTESPFTTNHTFTDKEKDPESGLIYFEARYYDPRIGLFIQQDPALQDLNSPEFRYAMMNPQLLNPYTYAGNNPMNFVDPNGEQAVEAAVATGSYFLGLYGPQISAMLPGIIASPRFVWEAFIRTAPITGDAIDIAESVLGRNALTGEKLSSLDASLTRSSVAMPIISGVLLRKIGQTDAAQGLMRAAREYKVNRIIKQAEAGAEQIKVASREQAIEAGMKFVGESPVRIVDRATSLPTGWRNADDTRIFREPAPKGYAGGREGANLEIWTKNSSGAREQVVNTHLVW